VGVVPTDYDLPIHQDSIGIGAPTSIQFAVITPRRIEKVVSD
jgi:hypothetical protein